MNLFRKNELQVRIDELEDILSNKERRLVELEQECNSYKQTISAFPGLKQQYEEDFNKVKEQHKKEVEGLKVKLTETEKSVNKRVVQALQSIGVDKFAMENTIIPKNIMNPQTAYEQFISMPEGKEKQEFFQKNESIIKKALGM